MKLMIPFDCTRLLFAILYIASFTITILFPSLYWVKHIAILAVLAIMILTKGCLNMKIRFKLITELVALILIVLCAPYY